MIVKDVFSGLKEFTSGLFGPSSEEIRVEGLRKFKILLEIYQFEERHY